MAKNITAEKEIEKRQQSHNNVAIGILFAYLLIDFLPGFKSSNTMASHFLYLNIVNIFTVIYLFYFRKIYALHFSELIDKNSVLKLYITFIALCTMSLIVANNQTLSVMRLSQILAVSVAIFNLSILLFDKKHLIDKIIFVVSIIAFIQSARVLLQFESFTDKTLISKFFKAGYLKGNVGNVNIFTVSVLYKVPFILLGIINESKTLKKWFYALALFSSLTIVFLINARATLLSLLLISIVFLVYYFSIKSQSQNHKIKSLFFIIPIALSFAFANFIFKQKESKGRYSSTFERAKKITPQGSKARLMMWNNAVEMAKDNPILGVGIGNWIIESIPYEPPKNRKISLNAHNDFLEILAETGFINGIIYVLLFVSVFVVNLRRIIFPRDDTSQKIALLALMILIVYATDAFFNFPLYKPSIQIAFVLAIALTFINGLKKQKGQYKINPFLFLIPIGFTTFYISFLIFNSSVLELQIRSDFRGKIDLKSESKISPSTIINHNPKIPDILLSSGDPFDFYTGIIFIKEKKYDSAKLFLQKADRINPYSGYSKLFLHLIAKQEGLENEAYNYLKNAFYGRARDIEMYEMVLKEALTRKDTTEIFKAYYHFNNIHQSPIALEKTITTLLSLEYPISEIVSFLEEQKELVFSKDTLTKANAVASSYFKIGNKYQETRERSKAYEFYILATEVNPNDAIALEQTGLLSISLGKCDKAKYFLKKAIETNQLHDGKSENGIGACYLLENDFKNACKYFHLAKEKGFPNVERLIYTYCNGN